MHVNVDMLKSEGSGGSETVPAYRAVKNPQLAAQLVTMWLVTQSRVVGAVVVYWGHELTHVVRFHVPV